MEDKSPTKEDIFDDIKLEDNENEVDGAKNPENDPNPGQSRRLLKTALINISFIFLVRTEN